MAAEFAPSCSARADGGHGHRLFDGSASRLMAHLVARGQLTAAQRRELQQLLTAAESPKPKRGDKSS